MRTITTTLYSFEELARPVQEKIIARQRDFLGGMQNEIDDEAFMDTLGALEEALGIKVSNWEVGAYSGCGYSYRFRITSYHWGELADNPRFLLRYLDEVDSYFRNRKTYYKWIPGTCTSKERKSKVLYSYDLPLTGCWSDAEVQKAWESRWDAVRRGDTIEEFIQDVLESFFSHWRDNRAGNYADEVIEDILREGYSPVSMYLEDGTAWDMTIN